MKIRPAGADCSMRADGRTDGPTHMTKLTVAFHNFPNTPELGPERTE